MHFLSPTPSILNQGLCEARPRKLHFHTLLSSLENPLRAPQASTYVDEHPRLGHFLPLTLNLGLGSSLPALAPWQR